LPGFKFANHEPVDARHARPVARLPDPELVELTREHIEETQVHAGRLKEILRRTAGESEPLKCKVVYSLFDEIEDLVQDASHVPVRDAALV
jgi:ferritin-like metal-binding protein YciE